MIPRVYQYCLLFVFFLLLKNGYSAKMSYKIEPIPAPIVTLGEGPHWDIERQSLYFVDIYPGNIFRYDYNEDKTYSCKVSKEEMVSFIIPIKGTSDKFAVGVARRVGIVQWDGYTDNCTIEKILFEVETEPEFLKNRFNDAKIDPRGRLYAGTMRLETLGEDLFEQQKGSFYKFDNKKAEKLFSNVGISNGLTWNEKAKKFYYIDSTALNITQYDYDVETGKISKPQVLIDFRIDGKRPNFVPDGMTIDKNGFLYVATYGGAKILIVNPKNGQIESEIKFPCDQITSAAFGGPNLDILYVTTSKMGDKPAPAGTTYKVTGLGPVGLPMNNMQI